MGAVAKRNMARSEAMTLYSDSSPNIKVSCDGKVLKAAVGLMPLAVVLQLSVFLVLMFALLIVFTFLWLRFSCGCFFYGLDADKGWLIFLFMEVFFLYGITLSSWCVLYLLNGILPYSAEIHIAAKTMIYRNKLWWRECQLTDDVSLLVEPNYTKGDWGFTLKIVSGGRKHLLLSGVFIGSYSKTISTARKLAKEIQKCVEYLRIEESKYWRYH